MRRTLAGLTLLLPVLVAVCLPATARADRLDVIHKRGVLIVGVKSDYPPFGMLDPTGAIVGFEPDLAADIAARLGVALRLVGVTSANRLQKVEDGSIDLAIATLGDTAERRRIATLVEPSYYASGASVMAPPGSPLHAWGDLRGRKVCATQGALFNREMAQRHLFDLQVFNGTRDAKLALRDGRCVGWLYDDTAIAGDLRNPEWAGYGIPLPSAMTTPWSIAIAAVERGSRLDRLIGDIVADWHRQGTLIAVERRWDLKPSAFLKQFNRLWTDSRPDGSPLCRRQPGGDGGSGGGGSGGDWPPDCRVEALVTSADTAGLHRLSLLIKERTGLDVSIIHDPYDRAQFLHGLAMTLRLAALCLFGSLLVGVLGAALIEARVPLASRAALCLATIGRMTPPLLQMYVIFFGIGSLVVTRYGWTFDGFAVAGFCLSLYAGSANIVALTDACAVMRARDPDFRFGRRSAGPVFRLAFGALSASLVNIVKATGMASAIAVPELISASTAILADRGNAGVMMNLLMAIYFLLVLAVVRLLTLLQRKVVGHGSG